MAGNGRVRGEPALIAALAAGRSMPQAAREAGCSERTVARRLADPGFRAKVNEARGQALASALGRLASSGVAAAEALTGLLADENAGVRLRAAVATLELAAKMRESVELEERLARLEQILGDAPRRIGAA